MSKRDKIPLNKLKSILLITDNHDMQTLLCQFLKKKNYSFYMANTAFIGIECYMSHSEDISIILNDYELPDMNGVDLYCILKLINPQLTILMTTDYLPIIEHYKCLDMREILGSPIDLSELSEILENLCV